MNKIISLSLNKFATIPHSLRLDPTTNLPSKYVSVDTANLYHHYYKDRHGRFPPDPNPALFEHLQYLRPENEFRIHGEGLGVSTASRRSLSSDLGHAFCRWFLHDHLDIIYFAHIDRVIRRSVHPAFGGLKIEKSTKGDAPDYFCAEDVNKIFLAEAKGRHEAISFSNKEFEKWRSQFGRISVTDGSGQLRKLKGFIVATRFATESKPYTKSELFAEDPDSPGEIGLAGEESRPLGSAILALHYADIADKINQPILSSALEQGSQVPAEIGFSAALWELRFGPYQGMQFVGGFYPPTSGTVQVRQEKDRLIFGPDNSFRLDAAYGTFLGVEANIFRQLVSIARQGPTVAAEIRPLPSIEFFYSGVSLLRDGSIIGPLEFFAFLGDVQN